MYRCKENIRLGFPPQLKKTRGGWRREGEENKEDTNHSGYIFQFSSMVKTLELITRQPSFKEALFIAQLQPRLF